MQPTYSRKIDTSATYTHKTWGHRANDSRLNAYDRLSTKVFWQEASESMSCSLEETAEVFETTSAHVINFCRTYEPTLLALKLNDSGNFSWTVLQTEPLQDYFKTVDEFTSFCYDRSLHPMFAQAVAYAKTLTCPNERRTFARQTYLKFKHLNDRTALGELKTELEATGEQQKLWWVMMGEAREQHRLDTARKLNELL